MASRSFNSHKVIDGSKLRFTLEGFKPNRSACARVVNGELEVTVEFNGKQYMYVSKKGFPEDGLDGQNPEENKGFIDVPTNVANLKAYL